MKAMRKGHTNYAQQRCQGYVARPSDLEILDELALESAGTDALPGRCLLITGESGSGKSSLIANWWQRQRMSSSNEINLVDLCRN